MNNKSISLVLLIVVYLLIGFLLSFHEPYLASICNTVGDITNCENNKISQKEWVIDGIKMIPIWPLIIIGVIK